MADQDDSTTQIVIHPNPPNPFSSFFSNFLQLFNSPPPKSSPTLPKSDKTDVSLPDTTPKLTVVRFSHTPSQEVSPIKLESQDADRNTNPVLLWQVYAVGGFFVLRWAWARWNERRGKNRPADEDDQPAQPAADN